MSPLSLNELTDLARDLNPKLWRRLLYWQELVEDDPDGLAELTEKAWYTYCLTVSPALSAARWGAVPGRVGKNGIKREGRWGRYEWKPRVKACLCGCGTPERGFAKDLSEVHRAGYRAVLAELILGDRPCTQNEKKRLDKARKEWPEVITDDELKLFKLQYKHQSNK